MYRILIILGLGRGDIGRMRWLQGFRFRVWGLGILGVGLSVEASGLEIYISPCLK